MSKYLTTLNELVKELANRDEEGVYKWVEGYLFHDYTAPYLVFSMIQSKSSFLTQLAEESRNNPSLRKNLEKSVANCYTKFSDDKELTPDNIGKVGEELFQLIEGMEINDLFERLKEDALSEKYKQVDVDIGTGVIDLHTYLLKSLFALDSNKNKGSLNQIIDRDIHNLKYSLECFEALYSSVGQEISGIEYMPILINQIDGANRDVKGTLKEYIETLEKSDFSCLHETPTKRLNDNEIKRFSYTLNILNKNIDGYNLQINNGSLMIQNTENQKTTVITMTPKLTEEIRNSLKYIQN